MLVVLCSGKGEEGEARGRIGNGSWRNSWQMLARCLFGDYDKRSFDYVIIL